MQWIYNFTQTERRRLARKIQFEWKKMETCTRIAKEREKGEWTAWMKQRNINFQLVFELCSVIRNQKPSCYAMDICIGSMNFITLTYFSPHSLVCLRESCRFLHAFNFVVGSIGQLNVNHSPQKFKMINVTIGWIVVLCLIFMRKFHIHVWRLELDENVTGTPFKRLCMLCCVFLPSSTFFPY